MSGGRQHFRIKDNLSVRWSIEDGVSGEGIVLDMSTKGRSACRGLNHHRILINPFILSQLAQKSLPNLSHFQCH